MLPHGILNVTKETRLAGRVLRAAAGLIVIMTLLTSTAGGVVPGTPVLVRQTMVAYVTDLLAGDRRGCTLMDERLRARFVALSRQSFKTPADNCREAIRAYSKAIDGLRRYLPSELKEIARARVTVHGPRATLVDAEDRVVFIYASGRWLLDWLS
jgi:hypothetical protein